MKRDRMGSLRLALNLAGAAALLLAGVALAVTWAASFRAVRERQFRLDLQRCRVWVDRGRVGVDNEPQRAAEAAKEKARQALASVDWEVIVRLRLRRAREEGKADWYADALDKLARISAARSQPPVPLSPPWSHSSRLALPAAAAVLLIASVRELARWRRWRDRRRAESGLCPSCGYDLRATPGRCPECGHVPEKGGLAA